MKISSLTQGIAAHIPKEAVEQQLQKNIGTAPLEQAGLVQQSADKLSLSRIEDSPQSNLLSLYRESREQMEQAQKRLDDYSSPKEGMQLAGATLGFLGGVASGGVATMVVGQFLNEILPLTGAGGCAAAGAILGITVNLLRSSTQGDDFDPIAFGAMGAAAGVLSSFIPGVKPGQVLAGATLLPTAIAGGMSAGYHGATALAAKVDQQPRLEAAAQEAKTLEQTLLGAGEQILEQGTASELWLNDLHEGMLGNKILQGLASQPHGPNPQEPLTIALAESISRRSLLGFAETQLDHKGWSTPLNHESDGHSIWRQEQKDLDRLRALPGQNAAELFSQSGTASGQDYVKELVRGVQQQGHLQDIIQDHLSLLPPGSGPIDLQQLEQETSAQAQLIIEQTRQAMHPSLPPVD